jgi:hypothetical protein
MSCTNVLFDEHFVFKEWRRVEILMKLGLYGPDYVTRVSETLPALG